MTRPSRLTALALAVAVVCLSSCYPATHTAETQPDDAVFSFVFAGDPQIGGLRPDADLRLAALARQANELNPDFVILAGDLCDSGENESQWARYDKAVAGFRMPVHSVIGNHDGPIAYRKRFAETRFSFVHHNCLFVGIDANLLADPQLSPQRQRECDEQWRWLIETLGNADAAISHVFLIMHHPPLLLSPRECDRLNSLLMKKPAHRVDFVLCGHIHMTTQSQWNGRVVYTTGGTGWVVDRHGLGFRMFTVHTNRVEQKFIPLFPGSPAGREGGQNPGPPRTASSHSPPRPVRGLTLER